MKTIPLQPLPCQIVGVTLANQVCQIKVYQKFFGVFMDLYVNNKLIIGGVICENLNRIVRSLYLGFLGDLQFKDTQGSADVEYHGIGTRFVLQYLEVSDLAPGEG
jgi:hypothetical protein